MSITEMHCYRIVPIFSVDSAFVLTDPLFEFSGSFPNICKPRWTVYQVDHLCGNTSDDAVDGKCFICVVIGEIISFHGVIALCTVFAAIVALG